MKNRKFENKMMESIATRPTNFNNDVSTATLIRAARNGATYNELMQICQCYEKVEFALERA